MKACFLLGGRGSGFCCSENHFLGTVSHRKHSETSKLRKCIYAITNMLLIRSEMKESEPAQSAYSKTGSVVKVAWAVIRSIIPKPVLETSMLATTRKVSSCCTGIYTAEMGMGCIQSTVNSSGYLDYAVCLEPTSCHDSCIIISTYFC